MTDVHHDLRLEGCGPVPLGSYLKALGIFRLVAEQKDATATACWRDERFVLRTTLTRDELIAFFVDEYRPSPILSPWNAGSGFYFQERKTNERGEDGKKKKTGVRDEATAATRTLDSLATSLAGRFEPLRTQAAVAKKMLEVEGHSAAPSDEQKARLVLDARSTLSDGAMAWIDASATLARGGLAFPPLLGSGGNDGRLDFSTTLVQALLALFDLKTGRSKVNTLLLLEAAIFDEACTFATSGAISQFASADSGGLNSSSGFRGDPSGNVWDVVLSIEGSTLLSSSAARRLGAGDQSGGAFPFTTPRGGALSAGAGGVALGDENTARGEFWAPLWSRYAGLDELAALYREGRAVVKRRGARNSVDFARAVARLGVSRGLDHFDRHAFEQRNGNMYVSVALPRRDVPRAPPPDLIADLDRGRWLDAVRSAFRDKKGSAALQVVVRRFDDALYRLAGDACPDAVQEALIAVGAVALECARRPRLRASDDGRRLLTPPPQLDARWRVLANDDTAEFHLAAALAGLVGHGRTKAAEMPFRAHLVPLDFARATDSWGERTSAEARVVWRGRDLVRDAAAVLDRRLIETQRTEFVGPQDATEIPLRSPNAAPLWAVDEFLAGKTDDERISRLAAGLAWVGEDSEGKRLSLTTRRQGGDDTPPFLYALLKTLFNPAGCASAQGMERRIVKPLPLLRLLLAGNVEAAAGRAQSMARGAGLPTPFLRYALTDRALDAHASPQRLAAALAFPIRDREWRKLTDRAYPDLSRDKEAENAA